MDVAFGRHAIKWVAALALSWICGTAAGAQSPSIDYSTARLELVDRSVIAKLTWLIAL
jgi:hypothetical protein